MGEAKRRGTLEDRIARGQLKALVERCARELRFTPEWKGLNKDQRREAVRIRVSQRIAELSERARRIAAGEPEPRTPEQQRELDELRARKTNMRKEEVLPIADKL